MKKTVYVKLENDEVTRIGPFQDSIAFWTDDGDCVILDLLTIQRGLECHKVTYE